MNKTIINLFDNIVDWYRKNPKVNLAVKNQLSNSELERYELSGAGIYFYIKVNKDMVKAIDDVSSPIDGPYIYSSYIDSNGGSLMWIENGYISNIELYANGTWVNENINSFELKDN